MIKEAKLSQQKINKTIASTEALLREYQSLSRALEQTNINLLHQQQIHSRQQTTLIDYEGQLSQVSQTENSLIPMLLEMIDWIDTQVNNDLPFHQHKRLARIAALKEKAFNPEIPISHLYHSVLEAFQIENEFGYSIESYQQEIIIDNKEVEAQILRVGRIGMYFLSLDQQSAGYWSQQKQSWLLASPALLENVAQGIKVAKKQLPPSLLTLTVEADGN